MKIQDLELFILLGENIHHTNSKIDNINAVQYHFTNLSGFRGIIQSHKLNLNSYKNLNDKNEGMLLKEYVFSQLEHVGSKKCKNKVDSFINDFENYTNNINLFTISFCQDCYNISLWGKYGNNKYGFCLGFKSEMFLDTNVEIANPKWPIVRMGVKYGKEQIRKDFEFYVSKFTELICLEISELRYKDLCATFATNIYVSLPRYKSKEWENENEFRLYMLDKTPGDKIPLYDGIQPSIGIDKYLCHIYIGENSTVKENEILKILQENNYSDIKVDKINPLEG